MGLVQRLRDWAEAKYDTELEEYLAAWRRSADVAAVETRLELVATVAPAAGFSSLTDIAGRTGVAAFDLFTRILLDTEESLARRFAEQSTDLWLIRSRQHLVCDLLSMPPSDDFEAANRMYAYQRLPRALARLSTSSGSAPPSNGGEGGSRVADDVPVGVSAIVALLSWYGLCQLFRRRIVLGGAVTVDRSFFGDFNLPGAALPPQRAAQLPAILVREKRALLPMLGNVGLDVPMLEVPMLDFEGPVREVYERPYGFMEFLVAERPTSLFTAGVHRFDTFAVGTKHVSDVRVFEPLWVDGRDLLQALEFLHEEIVDVWGLPPHQIVAAAISLCRFARGALLRPTNRRTVERQFTTRALVSAGVTEVETYLENELPRTMEALGDGFGSGRASTVAKAVLQQLVEVPRRQPPDRDGPQLKLDGPVPFVIREGDRVVIDLYALPLAMSSLVEFRPFTGPRVQEKGGWYEDAVRRFLVRSDTAISSVPSMEQEFRVRGRTVGEADVVVRLGDTAFVIECKSRRANRIDDCLTLDEARARARKVQEWASQARRTALHLATHPNGDGYEVPVGIDWLVPIVCSQLLEIDWDDSPESYLVPGAVSIFMRPKEVLDFISGDTWRLESARSWQYRVVR
jgi:Holliday junction resolvase-like predicted endonuclease